MGLRAWFSGLVPIAAMIMMECLDVGLVTLSKAAMSRGMNYFVFVVYYNALASLVFFLLSFIFHKSLSFSQNKKQNHLLSFSIIQFFFFGEFAEQGGLLSLSLTSVNSSFLPFLGLFLNPCSFSLLVLNWVCFLMWLTFVGLSRITVMLNWIFTGLSYSSPIVCYAMSNLIPAFNFLLALALR